MKYVLPVLLTIGCLVLDHLFLAEMERGNHPKAVRLKGLASLCFVLTGLWFTIFAGGGKHHLLIAFGLVLGLVGDVLLAMRFEYPEKHDQYFLIGAISFALGHVLYIAALLGVNGKQILSEAVAGNARVSLAKIPVGTYVVKILDARGKVLLSKKVSVR